MNEADSDSTTEQKGSNTVKSVETSFAIVGALEELDGGRVTEIARYTGLSKSSVHKHLATLLNHDFIVKQGGVYRLGLRFLDIGAMVREQRQGAQMIKESVKELAETSQEVGIFATEENGRSVVLYRESGREGVRTKSRVGGRLYMHQTAAGKAILASLPDERARQIIDTHGLPQATENTITNKSELYEELAQIRDRGLSFNMEESTKGLRAISAPVAGPNDTIVGACSIASPSHRMRGEVFKQELPELLLSVVNGLELNLTYSST